MNGPETPPVDLSSPSAMLLDLRRGLFASTAIGCRRARLFRLPLVLVFAQLDDRARLQSIVARGDDPFSGIDAAFDDGPAVFDFTDFEITPFDLVDRADNVGEELFGTPLHGRIRHHDNILFGRDE